MLTGRAEADDEISGATTQLSLIYLTMDEISRGVGASQVVPYAEGLARRGAKVAIHSFAGPESSALRWRLEASGVAWHPHLSHGRGAIAGAARVLHGAALVRGPTLVHARSDLAAAAALTARCPTWVWDVRSFWADQRIAMGMLRRGSAQERAMRVIESAAAAQSSAITTLTASAIEMLVARHGEAVRAKTTVIPTCVDLERFSLAPMPDARRPHLVLSGSFNRLYDLPLTLRFLEAVRRVRPADLTLLRPGPSRWDQPVLDAGGSLATAPFAEMPAQVRSSHAGLCICRTDDVAAICAAAPTKLAEFLATGRPVVVNAGLGDMDDLVTRYRCGAILSDESEDGLDEAASGLIALLDDDLTPMRCRAAATEHFDLDGGIATLLDVYRRLLPT